MKKFGLAVQIVIGLVLGIAVGIIFYQNKSLETYLQPIGDIFIRLIKMIVVPIVVSTLTIGVAGVHDVKKLGKLGGKTILYFEAITTVAIVVGITVSNLAHPGTGVNIGQLAKTDIKQYVNTAESVAHHGFADILVNIIPQNIVDTLARGDMLAIIFFSVMFGLGVAACGEKGKPVLEVLHGVSDAMFWVTNQVMKIAPLGVFALMGVTVSKFGVASLIPLGKLVICVYAAMIFFVIAVLGSVAKICGVNIFTLMGIIKDELILAFSTTSSETVLPKLMEKMENFGCPKSITSFVIPIGYSFNLDGSTLYQAIASLFIAQVYGIHLSIFSQVTLVLVLMLTSKGMAGVSGASFVVLLATAGTMGLPIEGVAFIAGIDRILDMIRTCVNVVGNSLAVIVMSKWEGQFDFQKSSQYLNEQKAGLSKVV